jgi:rhodanese-related sulfurtransferase
MKKYIAPAALLLALLVLASCAAPAASASPSPLPAATAAEVSPSPEPAVYQTITAREAKDKMDNDKNVIIVDVRTQEEYEAAHISGAILIPNENIAGSPPACLPDLDAEILVYCRTGRRSAEAAQKLADMGYTNVYDFGGIMDWPYLTIAGPAQTGFGCVIGNY